MTLFKALSMSEELNCRIIHRETGQLFKADYKERHYYAGDIPLTGWELHDEAVPISFEAEFVGCFPHEGMVESTTAFLFTGKHGTLMPPKTKLKVTLEPII